MHFSNLSAIFDYLERDKSNKLNTKILKIMAHYTTEDLMRFGLIHLLEEGRFNELIADIKNLFNGYEFGFLLSGEVMDRILVELDNYAYDIASQGEIEGVEGDLDMKVFNTARTFLLGILFEYIGHSNLEPDQFVKLITNHE